LSEAVRDNIYQLYPGLTDKAISEADYKSIISSDILREAETIIAGGSDNMDNNDMIMKYIEKIDQDRRDSEQKTNKTYEKLEQKIEKINDKIDGQLKWAIGIFVGLIVTILSIWLN
jgi:hypothetical protein